MTEHELNAWQKLSHACFHGGKIWGSDWTIRIVGRCPVTGTDVAVTVRGATLEETRHRLLADETLNRLLCDPVVLRAIGAEREVSIDNTRKDR
jgi:hypothetical protein